MKKMLIVVYSCTNGNTLGIAETLQEATGAELVRLETEEPYVGSYEEIVEQGRREVESRYMPPVKAVGVKVEAYDVVAIGTPTWWYSMAPAMRSFLEGRDFRGQTIVPFTTHAGWPGHAMEDIKAACWGAYSECEMEVQFDEEGGSRMITGVQELKDWVASVKKIL